MALCAVCFGGICRYVQLYIADRVRLGGEDIGTTVRDTFAYRIKTIKDIDFHAQIRSK